MNHQLAPPPRAVSRSLALQVRFGGAAAVAGWILVAAGVTVLLVFVLVARIDTAFYKYWDTLRTVPGTVTKVQGTTVWGRPVGRMIEGTSRQYYRATFRYETHKGVEHTTSCYGKDLPWLVAGARVTVEYPRSDHAHGRIKGLQKGIIEPEVLIILIFPFAGLLLGIGGLLWGGRWLRMLREGLPAHARLVDQRKMGVGKEARTWLCFEYQSAAGASHRLELRTPDPDKLVDEPWERLLYDPRRPSRAVLLDSLPGSPQVTPSGGFDTARPGRTRWLLLAPLISAVVAPLFVIWWLV